MRPGGLNNFVLPCHFPNQVLGVDQCKRTGYKCLGFTLDPYAIICDDGYVVETKSDGNHICRKIEVAISCQEISNLFKRNPVNKREGFKASNDNRIPAIFALTVDELPCEHDFKVREIIGADLCRRTGYTCLGWTPMYLECEKDYVVQNGRYAVMCTKKSDSPYCRDIRVSVDEVELHEE
uniref:Uncharacterized protein n=1 Tax=Acrobeloides nanus TaxID=290746 RepID=A0A914DLL6_9BILA